MLSQPQAIYACAGLMTLVYAAITLVRARILSLSLKGSPEDASNQNTDRESVNHGASSNPTGERDHV
jgi:hypothetical protein